MFEIRLRKCLCWQSHMSLMTVFDCGFCFPRLKFPLQEGRTFSSLTLRHSQRRGLEHVTLHICMYSLCFFSQLPDSFFLQWLLIKAEEIQTLILVPVLVWAGVSLSLIDWHLCSKWTRNAAEADLGCDCVWGFPGFRWWDDLTEFLSARMFCCLL